MPHPKSGDVDTKVQLPITAMLDMTFQLLFFFVINFHPADLEGQMDLMLPATTANAQPQVVPKPQPSGMEPEFPIDLTIRVISQGGPDSDGRITGLTVRTVEGREDIVADLDALQRYLRKAFPNLQNKESIRILPDSGVRLKHLMRVMDACRAAGLKDIRLLPAEG